MSIQAIAWVLDHSRSEGLDRLVLLSLANHANSETGQCDPGFRRIAHEANCAPSTVTSAVAKLVDLGEVVVLERGTGRGTTKYHLPWLSTGLCSARSESRTTGGVVRDRDAVVRDSEPVVRDLDRAEPINRKQNRASNSCECGYPRLADHDACPWCHARYPTALTPVDDLEPGGTARVEDALDAIREAREVARSKGRHPSGLFPEPERKDLA